MDASAEPIFLKYIFVEILFTHYLLLLFITHILYPFHFRTHANLNTPENFYSNAILQQEYLLHILFLFLGHMQIFLFGKCLFKMLYYSSSTFNLKHLSICCIL